MWMEKVEVIFSESTIRRKISNFEKLQKWFEMQLQLWILLACRISAEDSYVFEWLVYFDSVDGSQWSDNGERMYQPNKAVRT